MDNKAKYVIMNAKDETKTTSLSDWCIHCIGVKQNDKRFALMIL